MSSRRILFHRDFQGYTGGHGKVWDYFNHALALGWDARVFLSPCSLRGPDNPFMAVPDRIEPEWAPERADVLFLAGMDWAALPEGQAHAPVVNLVQHVRHADPALPLRRFLSRPATRICVSRAVATAIEASGEVAGPVRVIPAALDLAPVDALRPAPAEPRVLVAALKNPALGRALAQLLEEQGIGVRLLDSAMPRASYLEAMLDARVVVPLPHPTEGFFLPGLEAMALGRAVAMPPCVGSDEYATAGENCLMPDADPASLAAAVQRLLDEPALYARLVDRGRVTASGHDQAAERAAFAQVLAGVLA